MKHPLWKWILSFAAVGLAVPLGLMSAAMLLDRNPQLPLKYGILLNRIMLALWPSSILLMATAGRQGTLEAYKLVAFSVATNALLYAAIGGFVWVVAHLIGKFKRPQTHPRSGQRA